MTTIYLIRHAESIANTQGIYQGQSYDSELSPLGMEQATALAKKCASMNIEMLYSSPLKRTIQTAEAIKKHHPNNLKIVTFKEIMETNHGEWEGKSKQEIEEKWPTLYKLWLTNPTKVKFPGGETYRETIERTIEWFTATSKTSGEIAVVTHSNIIQIILAHINRIPFENLWSMPIPASASITTIEFHSPAKILIENDTNNILGLESDLRKHAI